MSTPEIENRNNDHYFENKVDPYRRYGYLMFGLLGLNGVMILVFIAGLEMSRTGKSLMVLQNRMCRLQTEVSFYLAGFIQSGDLRDLQRFRSLSAPILEMNRYLEDPAGDGEQKEQVLQVFQKAGLMDREVSRIFGGKNFFFGWLSGRTGLELSEYWQDMVGEHEQIMDYSRRLLRDQVQGRITEDSRGTYLRQLQTFNDQRMRASAELETQLVHHISRVSAFFVWFPSVGLMAGLLLMGYTGRIVTKKSGKHRQQLERSRSSYQDLFEQAGIGIAQTTPDGKLLWANHSLVKILGYETLDDLYSRLSHFFRVFVDTGRKADYVEQVRINGKVSGFIFQAVRKDEKKIWMMSNARAVYNETGKIICMEGSYQDYTLYRQTNQELHYVTKVLRGVAQSIHHLHMAGDIHQAVAEMIRILGKAAGVDRVGVFECRRGSKEVMAELQYEWTLHDSLKTLNDAAVRTLILGDETDEPLRTLEQGRVAQMMTDSCGKTFRKSLRDRKTQVIMLAPIYVSEDTWGYISFENCLNVDRWPDEISQILKSVAAALGHFIQKNRMELTLTESTNRYRTLVRNLKEVVFQMDLQGVLEYLNPVWEEITGYAIEESVGRPIFDFLHDEDHKEGREMLEAQAKGSTRDFKVESRLKTRSGKICWVEWQGTFIAEADPARSGHLFGTMYDMTERKKSELVMKQNHQRLQALIESSPLVITVFDRRGKIGLWNGAAEKTLGWTRKEVMGKPPPDVPDSLRAAFEEIFKQALAGSRVQGAELERKRKNGSSLYTNTSAAPIFDDRNQVEQVIMFSQDVTDAKLSREAIRKSLKEKDVLLSEIHHRVKNNMAVISGLLTLKAQEQTDPKITSILKESESRIRSMAMIHEKLYQTDTFAEVEFSSYLQDLLDHLKSQYEVTASQIETHLEVEDIYLEITQAVPCGLLVNELISNGYKHAFAGRESGHIRIGFRQISEDCELRYEDDGVGLPDEILESLEEGSLGMNLIGGLSQQLKGSLKYGNSGGAWFILKFPLP